MTLQHIVNSPNQGLKGSWVSLVRKDLSKYEKSVLASPEAYTPKILTRLVAPKMLAELSEVMYIACLDGAHHIIALSELARGGRGGLSIRAREVFPIAIAEHATSIVLIHNHPSGNATPSQEDIEMTKKIIQCGEILGVPLVDHIVIASKRKWTSIRDKFPNIFTV